MSIPVSVEPVNDTMRGTGCETSASPISSAGPTTTLSTPSGSPASSRILARSRPPVTGVFDYVGDIGRPELGDHLTGPWIEVGQRAVRVAGAPAPSDGHRAQLVISCGRGSR
ncbi:hypothetical protein ABH927_005850 [Planotetraspora sp. GP83]